MLGVFVKLCRSAPAFLLGAGLFFFTTASVQAQDIEADPWTGLQPKLTGLGRILWDFAGTTPYLGEIPRAASVEEADSYGYYLDEAGGFLYSASWDGPCGCGERFRAAAFKKSGGGYLLVKSGIGDTCYGIPRAEATEPWADILPPGFSLQNFYRDGEKAPPGRGFFLIEVEIPEKGLGLTLTARPILNVVNMKYDPETVFLPLKDWDWFDRGGVDIDVFALPLRDDLAEALQAGRLDPRFSGLIDYTPEDLRALAAELLRGSGSVWRISENGQSSSLGSKERGAEGTPEDIANLAGRLAFHYEIYREYLKLEVKSFVLEWSGADGRFKIKKAVPLDLLPPFLDFMTTDAYPFKGGC